MTLKLIRRLYGVVHDRGVRFAFTKQPKRVTTVVWLRNEMEVCSVYAQSRRGLGYLRIYIGRNNASLAAVDMDSRYNSLVAEKMNYALCNEQMGSLS